MALVFASKHCKLKVFSILILVLLLTILNFFLISFFLRHLISLIFISSSITVVVWAATVLVFIIVRKGVSTFLANQSSQVFCINRNATVKLSVIDTFHVKQQDNVGFFIFKFTQKYMLGNVYISKYMQSNVYI